MLLPNAEIAELDIRKLIDYCLNPDHPEGKHKARLFSAALSLTADDAGGLRDALLQAVRTVNASVGLLDEYGQRYTVDFEYGLRGRTATIRSGWIIEHGSEVPRLTTCYPL
jgi:hypothetical protein